MRYHHSIMDNRRKFLAAAGVVLAACGKKKDAEADAEPSRIGKPLKAYGERASFEKSARLTPTTKQMENGATRTPLADAARTAASTRAGR